jgi:hypothetical protein
MLTGTLHPVVADSDPNAPVVEAPRKLQLPPPVALLPRPPKDRFPPPLGFTFVTEPE